MWILFCECVPVCKSYFTVIDRKKRFSYFYFVLNFYTKYLKQKFKACSWREPNFLLHKCMQMPLEGITVFQLWSCIISVVHLIKYWSGRRGIIVIIPQGFIIVTPVEINTATQIVNLKLQINREKRWVVETHFQCHFQDWWGLLCKLQRLSIRSIVNIIFGVGCIYTILLCRTISRTLVLYRKYLILLL